MIGERADPSDGETFRIRALEDSRLTPTAFPDNNLGLPGLS
jgi:hypothetical protein